MNNIQHSTYTIELYKYHAHYLFTEQKQDTAINGWQKTILEIYVCAK